MFGSWTAACIKARASVWERWVSEAEQQKSGKKQQWQRLKVHKTEKKHVHASTCACCEQFPVHVCACLPQFCLCQVLHAELPQSVGARQTNPSLCKTGARAWDTPAAPPTVSGGRGWPSQRSGEPSHKGKRLPNRWLFWKTAQNTNYSDKLCHKGTPFFRCGSFVPRQVFNLVDVSTNVVFIVFMILQARLVVFVSWFVGFCFFRLRSKTAEVMAVLKDCHQKISKWWLLWKTAWKTAEVIAVSKDCDLRLSNGWLFWKTNRSQCNGNLSIALGASARSDVFLEWRDLPLWAWLLWLGLFDLTCCEVRRMVKSMKDGPDI